MDVGASIIGGLAGGGVMIVLLYMGMAVMPSQMKMNLLLLLGTLTLTGIDDWVLRRGTRGPQDSGHR